MKIHILDTRHLDRSGIIAATALETSDGVALFDTGPESTFENVVHGLRSVGLEPEDVRHVFLSHIHFDHAGAAWRFGAGRTGSPSPGRLRRVNRTGTNGATIYVHPKGAPHLVDPTKLVESATRIFGDEMERLWGEIAPVPADRVKILQDNETVSLPPFEIRAIATPGHASHHHVYHWDDNLFGGDIAGVQIGTGPPIPPFVPPELHVESWRDSIAKMRTLNAANLYLPHYGKISGSVRGHLDILDERVARWAEWFRDKIRAGSSEPDLRPAFTALEHSELRAGGATQSDVDGYEAADPSYMAVGAAIRYWKKYHAEVV